MAIIKEFREFFLRNIKLPIGTKKDQEANVAVTYTAIIDGVSKTVYNRFLKNNYPSEDVFKKLFESITFKLNTEDTATTSEQGLVKIATDNQVQLGTSTVNGYQLVPKPSQVLYLYTVNSLPTNDPPPNDPPVNILRGAGNFKVGDLFLIVLTTSADFGKLYVCTDANTPTFSLLGVTHPIPIGGTTGQVIEKINSTNFNTQWATPILPNGTKIAMLYISQTSTNAPTAVEIKNSIGTFTYSYTNTGLYAITCTGAFLATKTFIRFSGVSRLGGKVDILRNNDNVIVIATYNFSTGAAQNALLGTDWLEIITLP
mgnify:CR=1 FL=1